MIRTLLTTTAIALTLSVGAYAQTDNSMAPADNTMAPAENTMAPADNTMAPADNTMAPADNTMAPADNTMAPADNSMAAPTASMGANDFDMATGYTRVDTDNLVTRLLGMPVYSSPADDAEEIGTVNDLVFTHDGNLTAVVIGVGGFLGIGEKNVAVDFNELTFEIAADNTERWVLPTTAEALTSAPDFVWEDDAPADGMAPAGDAMAPADTMAPAEPAAVPAQ